MKKPAVQVSRPHRPLVVALAVLCLGACQSTADQAALRSVREENGRLKQELEEARQTQTRLETELKEETERYTASRQENQALRSRLEALLDPVKTPPPAGPEQSPPSPSPSPSPSPAPPPVPSLPPRQPDTNPGTRNKAKDFLDPALGRSLRKDVRGYPFFNEFDQETQKTFLYHQDFWYAQEGFHGEILDAESQTRICRLRLRLKAGSSQDPSIPRQAAPRSIKISLQDPDEPTLAQALEGLVWTEPERDYWIVEARFPLDRTQADLILRLFDRLARYQLDFTTPDGQPVWSSPRRSLKDSERQALMDTLGAYLDLDRLR